MSRCRCGLFDRDVQSRARVKLVARDLTEALRTFTTSTRNLNPVPFTNPQSNHHNGIRVESCRSYVRSRCYSVARKPILMELDSYNRYISVASRVVRRSLKEDKRIAAERRGESELRFSKWEVRKNNGRCGYRVQDGANG